LSDFYNEFLNTKFTTSFGEYGLSKPLILWVNDGLMAVFFFLIGLELKREVLEGELKVDESQLTGEADEVKKGAQDALMSGSFVIAGQGLARLEKVGNDSYINQLSLEAKQVKSHEESDMVHAVNRIVGIIGLLIIPLGSLLFLRSYVSLGDSLKLSVTSTVGALIGMIPEGLYLLMTLALALGAIRLVKEKVLLNSMKGIETLSRVDVLCVDKTGTITEPGMEVTEIRPVKDAQDLETLAQYVEASMDQNDTMDAIRKFHKTSVSQHWKTLENTIWGGKLR